jgi:prepilin-type N-terminal cleavage/methylation domain-containing protein
MSLTSKNKSKGFTLLELLLALAILGFISVYTAQSIRTTVRFSKKMQNDIDINAEIHSAINLLKADIARAFNYRDLYIAVYNEAQREHIKRWQEEKNKPQNPTNPNPNNPVDPNNPNPTPQDPANPAQVQAQNQGPPPEYKPRLEQILTQFIGEKGSLNFTSLNGNAIRKNTYASEVVEIGYEVKKCKRRSKEQKDTECLWRRLSYHLDGEVLEGGQESVLIEDVTNFELKYLRKQTEDEVEWLEAWPIDNVNTQNQLPIAIEINLEVSKPIDKEERNFKKKRVLAYVPIDFQNNQNIRNIMKMNAQGNPLTGEGQNNPLNDPNLNQGPSNGFGNDNSGGF